MAAGLGAVIAAFAAISIALLIVRSVAREAIVTFGVPAVLAFLAVAICAALFLVLTHTQNIKRIVRGEEKQLTIGGKDKKDE